MLAGAKDDKDAKKRSEIDAMATKTLNVVLAKSKDAKTLYGKSVGYAAFNNVKVAVIVSNYSSMYAMYLVTYVFFGIALGVLAFALYDRLNAAASSTMRVATAIGLLWSVALVTSGMVWNYGMTTIVALAKTDPTQAQLAWQAIEPVSSALGGAGGEILGGLWVLLVSVVALRGGALPKLLGWFGAALGVVGLASVVLPLHDAAIVFGLMTIVWFAWVGVTLVRTKAAAVEADSPARAERSCPTTNRMPGKSLMKFTTPPSSGSRVTATTLSPLAAWSACSWSRNGKALREGVLPGAQNSRRTTWPAFSDSLCCPPRMSLYSKSCPCHWVGAGSGTVASAGSV